MVKHRSRAPFALGLDPAAYNPTGLKITNDPVVYLQVAVTGRKPLGDLFYILRDAKTFNAYRVYFEEVVTQNA